MLIVFAAVNTVGHATKLMEIHISYLQSNVKLVFLMATDKKIEL
ncbi:hypothetical protein IWX86_001634 [Polaromonas sp. CG_9.2]|nr:hypothetical protein [Polaromonas sp. CG_9.2]MDH6183796.1 hypothetical protein [Polaromonas sp. CG_23.6]